MNCPLCIDEMLEPNHRAGIEIDVCPNCRGVWLDRDELESLIGSGPAPRTNERTPMPTPPLEAASGQPVATNTQQTESAKTTTAKPKSAKPKSGKPKSGKKSKKKKTWADRLGDALEEVLDL